MMDIFVKLDHLTVSGSSLEEATAYIENSLEVTLQKGGNHPEFGTHNNILVLTNRIYLEAIAIDPKATKPDMPRWFDLDNFVGPPRLTNWVCRCNDINKVLKSLPIKIGQTRSLSRGKLSWDMVVPTNGKLPYQGAFPALIKWKTTAHPANTAYTGACSLLHLTITHPQASIIRELFETSLDKDISIEESTDCKIYAEFKTPNGVKILE